MRAPIAAAAALVLGVGAFFAIAVPAATAGSGDFTVDDVTPTSNLHFSGDKAADETLDHVELAVNGGPTQTIAAECTPGATTWDCTYAPDPALEVDDTGILTVTFTVPDSDPVTQQATFTVVADDPGFLFTVETTRPSTGVHFHGVKPTSSSLTFPTVQLGEATHTPDCTGMDAGSTTWSCTYSGGDVSAGQTGTASVQYNEPGQSSSSQRVDFTVYPDPPTVELSYDFGEIEADFSANANATGQAALYPDGSDTPYDTCDWSSSEGGDPYCSFYGFPSGAYHLVSNQTVGGNVSGDSTWTMQVPNAPTIALSGPDGSATIHGTGTPGDTVHVAGEGDGYYTVCNSVPVAEDGTWSCTGEGVSYYSSYIASDVDAGTHAWSPGAEYRPTPSADYLFLPGGVSVTANGSAPGGAVAVTLYPLSSEGQEACPFNEQPGPIVCTYTNIDPGDYAVQTQDSDYYDNHYVEQYFTIPVAPAITAANAAPDGSVTIAGTGIANDGLRVYVDQAGYACGSTIISGSGDWSCTITGLPSGDHVFQAAAEDLGPINSDYELPYVQGGLSPLTDPETLTVLAPITPTNPTTPTTPTTPKTPITPIMGWAFTVTGVDLNNVHPGDKFTVTGNGLPPGSTVSGELHSTPYNVGSTAVGSDGSFSLPVVVPADFEPGAHQLIMTLTLPGGTAADAIPSTQPLTVVPGTASNGGAADQSGTTEEKSGDASNPHETKGGAVGAEENILTHGLQSIADVAAHPGKIPAAFAIGLVLLLFAVLPAHLLNATLAEQYERFTRRVPALKRRPAWFARLTAWLRRAPVLGGVLITTITAILFGFADPRFGFTLASLRLILGLAIALAIVVYGVNALTSLIMRRRWNVAVQLSLRPLGLLLTVVGVVISRLLDFSPGFLIGLVLGLTIAERASAKYAWRAILVRSGLVMGIAIVAWLGFSIFSAGETESDVSHFGNELFLETLVAIVTEGIVALLIELLPFRLLEGERLYRRSRVLWGAVYLVALVIFIVAVVPWEGNWATLGSSLWVWIAIVAGFGIVCTGIYLYFRFFAPPLESEDHPEGGDLVSVAEEE